MRGQLIDLTGRKVGRLTVERREGSFADKTPAWLCQCECGGSLLVRSGNLVKGKSASCGCLKRDRNRALWSTHGDTNTPEHRSWTHLKGRCLNPKNKRYADYGGRGIKVCDRWRDSYNAFLEDMGRRPSARHSLDRIDNDGNYEPGNCRWATASEQNSNQRPRRTRKP